MDFDLVCTLVSTSSLVDELTTIKWKRQQEAVVEMSETGLVVVAEELNCLHARAFFRKELFMDYVYRPDGLIINSCSSVFRLSDPSNSNSSIGAEIRTLLPDMNPPEWALDVDTSTPQNAPVSFAIRSSVLKELIEDLEWPGASVRISISPQPAGVTFLAQGHGDLQVDLLVGRCNNLFVDFKCHRPISFLYRYKHLSAATASIPAAVLKENHASKLTIDRHGLLRVQHVVNMRATGPGGRNANDAPDGFDSHWLTWLHQAASHQSVAVIGSRNAGTLSRQRHLPNKVRPAGQISHTPLVHFQLPPHLILPCISRAEGFSFRISLPSTSLTRAICCIPPSSMATATARSLVCAHFTAAQLSPAEGESSSLKAFAKSVKSNGLSAVPHSRKSVANRRRTCANGSSSRRRQPVMAAAGDGATKKCRITLLPGDGIGPEIMAVAVKLLKSLGELEGITFEFKEALVGGAAIDEFGVPLPESTLATCRDSDAVLLAAIGGYKWDTLPADLRPERGLLGLRAGLGAFANLRPATVFPQLIDASSLKREVVEGVDIMVVRELTGGIYFGEPKGFGHDAEGNRTGFNTMIYSVPEIDRIARVGFEAARKRSGRLCSVEKSNVLEVSQLWRERVTAIGAEEYPDVELSHMYVDNAAMQLIRNPRQFDTIVTGNIFGDILSDEASMLTGSIGMLPSASIGSDGPGIYEPVHGSAPDIAGQDKANPMAQVLSAAMMLRYGLNLPRGADLLEAAVMSTLEAGYRTGDIASPGTEVVGCSKMSEVLFEKLYEAHAKLS
ncbi:unnamed protein product [Closterium sp. Yama58-4]|nr:unnamed protein product [Closterium sp. Yama58-4]